MSFGGPSSRDDWWNVHRAEAAVIEAAKACRRFLVAAKGSRASTPTKTLAAAIDALLAAEARATHPMLFAAPDLRRLSSDAPDSQHATAATSGAPSLTCDIEGCDEPAVSVWFDDETFTDWNVCEGCQL